MSNPESPNNFRDALKWFKAESKRPLGTAPTPSGTWENYCLMDCRIPYGIPALASTAWGAWIIADDSSKHVTSDLSQAPVGSALITKGSNAAGHIMIAAFPFPSHAPGAWSNDLVRHGQLDKVHRDAPRLVWGHELIGWMDEINGYDLQLGTNKPAKPKDNKRYRSIEKAIGRLEDHALKTAKATNDHSDAKALRMEINDLKVLYSKLRHS